LLAYRATLVRAGNGALDYAFDDQSFLGDDFADEAQPWSNVGHAAGVEGRFWRLGYRIFDYDCRFGVHFAIVE
jgi:hypothetical protein